MTQTPRSVENSHGGSTKGPWARVAGGALAAGAALALLAGVGAAGAAPSAATHSPHKSYVCKYVSKPGQAERLQSGQNPIWVDNHSLLGYDGTVTVGQQFKDGQFRSVVIVANTPKLNPEPPVSDCPPVTPPTSTKTTTPPVTKTTTPPVTKTTTPPVTKTTTPPVTKTTTPPVRKTTTPVTTSTTPPTTPAPAASTYPLQPVKAGVDADVATSQLAVTPVQALLVLLALVGLLIALGVRLPRVIRPGADDRDA